MRIEESIITNLMFNEEFCRKVVPFLKKDYFKDTRESVIVSEIVEFFSKYNKPINKEALLIEVSNRKDVNDKDIKDVEIMVKSYASNDTNLEWLITNTEKFCKDRAVYNAILDCISIIDGKDSKRNNESIPHILSDALAVSFDNHVGHDYIDDASDRFDFYRRKEEKLPFDLEIFNKITKGGLSKKTLSVILASTGVGKSLFMCHVAASTLMQGKNVLYITMEMAEEKIAERIDANLLNVTIDDLSVIEKTKFNSKIENLKLKTQGKLIIKEYPTSSAHSGHFRALLEELKIKKDFIPDLVVIDYLNICGSAKTKLSNGVNSYTLIKSIAEELRGLAVEHNIPILSATQSTRNGFDNTDLSLSDTSESAALPATVDFMFALMTSEDLEGLNQILVKQLKNRYSDPSYYKRFVIGVDRSKMKLYDVESQAQNDISDAGHKNSKYESKPTITQSDGVKSFKGFKF